MAGKHRPSEHLGRHRSIPVPHRNRAVVVTGVTLAAGGMLAAPAVAAPADVNWDAIAACESGGQWNISTGNGYLGGLQWSLSTWHANGGTGSPVNASREQQIAVADRIIATQGMARGLANWPVCGARAGSTAVAPTRHAVTTDRSTPPRHAAPPAVVKPATPSTPTSNVPASPVIIGPTVDYVVAAGDTLAQIATARNASGGWSQLAGLNGLTDPDVLTVGQHLKVPAPPIAIVPPVTAGIMNMTADVATALTGQPVGVALPVPAPAPVPTAAQTVAPAVAPAAFTVKASGTTGGLAARAVSAAVAMKGVPYVWGGTSAAGVDCSGLVQRAFKAAGLSLPRTAAQQATVGRSVSLSQLQPGDLIFYRYGSEVDHVAMSVGAGKIVEASQPGQPVAVRALYTSNFAGARRLIG